MRTEIETICPSTKVHFPIYHHSIQSAPTKPAIRVHAYIDCIVYPSVCLYLICVGVQGLSAVSTRGFNPPPYFDRFHMRNVWWGNFCFPMKQKKNLHGVRISMCTDNFWCSVYVYIWFVITWSVWNNSMTLSLLLKGKSPWHTEVLSLNLFRPVGHNHNVVSSQDLII